MEGLVWNLSKLKRFKWKNLKLRGQNKNIPSIREPKVNFSLIFKNKIEIGIPNINFFDGTHEFYFTNIRKRNLFSQGQYLRELKFNFKSVVDLLI